MSFPGRPRRRPDADLHPSCASSLTTRPASNQILARVEFRDRSPLARKRLKKISFRKTVHAQTRVSNSNGQNAFIVHIRSKSHFHSDCALVCELHSVGKKIDQNLTEAHRVRKNLLWHQRFIKNFYEKTFSSIAVRITEMESSISRVGLIKDF